MPRSTRHKSSKHSSRDVRDFSDSERDSGVKDRKDSTRESSVRASKELTSGEKRKLDSKENKESFGSGNGEYSEEYTSSKRRKERLDGSANDRWNGRGQDDRGEKKSKPSSESRSTKRRDESVGVYGDGEESGKKNSGKIEGKHRESSRKEGEGERVRDRERKGKEGKIERLVDGEDHHSLTKQVTEKTESFARDQLRSSEMENQFERRIKRNRDGSGDGDKHQDDIGDVNSRRQSSKNDITKDGRSKDEKHKDERYRDKHQKDMDKNNRQRDEKQRDEKDHVHSWSDEKYLRDGKDTTEARQKKSKTQDTDRNREHDDERGDLEYNNYHERDQDHDHNRDRNHDRGRERDPDRDYDCDWDWDGDQDRDIDHDGSHLDDQGARHKDSRGKKRSPDDPDDYNDKKSRGLGASYHDAEKKSLSSGRVEPDRGRSHSHQALRETIVGGSRRSSPSSSSHGVPDEYRHFKSEDSKYRDGGTKQRSRPNSSQDTTGFSGSSGRASKYRSTEEPTKPDDGYKGEFSAERPSSSKASPIGLVDRSPSSMSLERKYMSRTAVRRSLDIEESGRRNSSSMGARDSSVAEDRSGRDLPLADGSPQADSSFYSRTSQGISSSFVTPPITFRGRVGSPSFLGSLEEDTRVGHGTRYRRNSDPNFARVQGNAWRGPPSWSSPVPNGFISFQHGPPHGGFQTMMPQFSSPPMFGVRPSMDINASGIPYTFPDADQFSGHLRPHGWQNMMDGSGPPHLHGWDGSNGVYRDEPHMYGGPNWDQNRHHVNGRGWESGGDAWKGQNGDVNMDLPPMSQEEDLPMRSMVDDVHTGQLGQKSQYENNHGTVKPTEMASIVTSPSKEMSKSSPKVTREKSSDTTNEDDVTWFCRAYLSKLDISTELTDPELYGQYMTLLNREQNGTAGRDINMLVSLQDDGRAIFKSSSSFLGLKLLPVADDSVFQRAMDFYKKQRVNMRALENVCGGPSDIISASNLGKMEEPGNICNVEMVEEPNSILETSMEDAPDQEKAETVAAAVPKDKLEEPVLIYDSATLEVPYQEKAEAAAVYAEDNLEERASTPSQVVQDQVTHTLPNKKLEVLGDGSPVEPVQNLSREGMDGMTCEEEDRKDTRGDFMVTSDNASCATPVLVTDSKGKKEVSKGEASGDAVRCPLPLFLSDGSPNASGALLPGSNESVILNRIHHSPESTH